VMRGCNLRSGEMSIGYTIRKLTFILIEINSGFTPINYKWSWGWSLWLMYPFLIVFYFLFYTYLSQRAENELKFFSRKNES